MSSDAAFSGDGSAVINAQITVAENYRKCGIEEFYEVEECVDWLRNWKDVKRVALQFPDNMLGDSVAVISQMQQRAPALLFFILADTSYGSCCVDSIAAQHYNADVLIHYGQSCLSPTTRIPVRWVYGRAPINVEDCVEKLCRLLADKNLANEQFVLMYSVEYSYCREQLFQRFKEKLPNLVLSYLGPEAKPSDQLDTLKVNGRSWSCPKNSALKQSILYIGGESRTLTNLMLTMNSHICFTYDPISQTARQETSLSNKSLMKRFYMIEKAKDARIVGIVVGTLGVDNYLDIHDRLKELIKKAGKKSYSFVVGKLNPAKLANFMEIDVFVLISCPENSLIDSSDFYRPIVTPYEMELACNNKRAWTGELVTDFRSLLPGGSNYQMLPEEITFQTDISLISGQMRKFGLDEETCSVSGQVAVREKEQSLVLASASTNAGEFLASRSWVGLEQDLGLTSVEKAKQGQTGIAEYYHDEPV